jgi:hypothetical protein
MSEESKKRYSSRVIFPNVERKFLDPLNLHSHSGKKRGVPNSLLHSRMGKSSRFNSVLFYDVNLCLVSIKKCKCFQKRFLLFTVRNKYTENSSL